MTRARDCPYCGKIGPVGPPIACTWPDPLSVGWFDRKFPTAVCAEEMSPELRAVPICDIKLENSAPGLLSEELLEVLDELVEDESVVELSILLNVL
jgi:hypothetical protein